MQTNVPRCELQVAQNKQMPAPLIWRAGIFCFYSANPCMAFSYRKAFSGSAAAVL